MSDQDEPLESGLIADISKSKAQFEQEIQFQWEFYSELAFQRNQVYDPLKASLRERASPYEFQGWQRAVKYRYSLDPLSTKGSLIDPGGRFNVGTIDTMRYPVFPALYLGSDKGVALAELLGRGSPENSLTAEELALTRPESVSVVCVSGKVESVLDIREPNNLTRFVTLIKDFRLSRTLISKARKLGIKPLPLRLVRTVAGLLVELQSTDWRSWPMLFDVPSPSQIFGRIVLDAGIEGILYSSVLTRKACFVLYPQNFANSSSYVALDDPVPSGSVQTRIDATSFQNFI